MTYLKGRRIVRFTTNALDVYVVAMAYRLMGKVFFIKFHFDVYITKDVHVVCASVEMQNSTPNVSQRS